MDSLSSEEWTLVGQGSVVSNQMQYTYDGLPTVVTVLPIDRGAVVLQPGDEGSFFIASTLGMRGALGDDDWASLQLERLDSDVYRKEGNIEIFMGAASTEQVVQESAVLFDTENLYSLKVPALIDFSLKHFKREAYRGFTPMELWKRDTAASALPADQTLAQQIDFTTHESQEFDLPMSHITGGGGDSMKFFFTWMHGYITNTDMPGSYLADVRVMPTTVVLSNGWSAKMSVECSEPLNQGTEEEIDLKITCTVMVTLRAGGKVRLLQTQAVVVLLGEDCTVMWPMP